MSGGISEVKTFEVFLGVGIWSRLYWVGLLFFGSCCLLWILSHCNGCGVPIVRLQIIPCHRAMEFLLEVLKLGGSLKNPSFECYTIIFKAGRCMNSMEKFDYKSNILYKFFQVKFFCNFLNKIYKNFMKLSKKERVRLRVRIMPLVRVTLSSRLV